MDLPTSNTVPGAIVAHRDRIPTPVKLAAALVAACFALGAPTAFAADAPASQSAKSANAKPAKSKPAKKNAGKKKSAKLAGGAPLAGGMVVHIDPNTGEFLKEPIPGRPGLVLSPAERNALSTSHQGLYEEAIPGGGYKLDHQGRFQSSLVATVGADGKIIMRHLDDSSGVKK